MKPNTSKADICQTNIIEIALAVNTTITKIKCPPVMYTINVFFLCLQQKLSVSVHLPTCGSCIWVAICQK